MQQYELDLKPLELLRVAQVRKPFAELKLFRFEKFAQLRLAVDCREAFFVDPGCYVWVPGTALST